MADESMELQIDVGISDYRAGGNLRLSERVVIRGGDFGTLASILGKFHELLTVIKAAGEADHG